MQKIEASRPGVHSEYSDEPVTKLKDLQNRHIFSGTSLHPWFSPVLITEMMRSAVIFAYRPRFTLTIVILVSFFKVLHSVGCGLAADFTFLHCILSLCCLKLVLGNDFFGLGYNNLTLD